MSKTKPNLDYWFVNMSGKISRGLVPGAYDSMDTQTAKQVRDELSELIEWMENE